MRIPGGDDAVVGEQHNGKSSSDLAERVDDPGQQGVGPRVRDQMNDHLAVRRRLENRTVGLEFIAKHLRIDKIPVVRQRKITEGKIDRERLNVLEILASGCRIAIMTNGHRAGQVFEGLIIVDIGDQSHALVHVEMIAIGRDNPGRFLPA